MLEGLFGGLWLNKLLYPAELTRAKAERQVLDYLGLVFAKHSGTGARVPCPCPCPDPDPAGFNSG